MNARTLEQFVGTVAAILILAVLLVVAGPQLQEAFVAWVQIWEMTR
jgi:uncharacterized membrane protein YccC